MTFLLPTVYVLRVLAVLGWFAGVVSAVMLVSQGDKMMAAISLVSCAVGGFVTLGLADALYVLHHIAGGERKPAAPRPIKPRGPDDWADVYKTG